MNIVEFLKEYWLTIAIGIIIVIDLIILIVKRRPKTVDEFDLIVNEVIGLIPSYVSEIERIAGNVPGSEKKSFLIQNAVDQLTKRLHRGLTDREEEYFVSKVSSVVEEVLYAPTKKGGIGREKAH